MEYLLNGISYCLIDFSKRRSQDGSVFTWICSQRNYPSDSPTLVIACSRIRSSEEDSVRWSSHLLELFANNGPDLLEVWVIDTVSDEEKRMADQQIEDSLKHA